VACDPDGVKAGVFTVTTAGEYGPLYVYGDDSITAGTDEGATTNDLITFYINGKRAATLGPGVPTWSGSSLPEQLDLMYPAPGQLALGYTGGSWSNYLALYNPGGSGVDTDVLFTKVDASTVPYSKTLTAGQRYSFKVDNVGGMSNTDYSTKVTSDVPVIAELGLYWTELNPVTGGSGGFAMRAGRDLYTTQYIAYGNTSSSWSNYLALFNPGSETATVKVTFVKPDASKVTYDKTLTPGERFSFKVNNVAGMSSTEYSTRVTSTVGIIAELGEYWTQYNVSGGSGGFAMRGTPATPKSQTVALGYTGGSWENRLAVYNPLNATTNVTATFTKVDGSTVTKTLSVGADQRTSFVVDDEPGMSSTDYSTKVEADAGVVAELGLFWTELNPVTGGSGGFVMRGSAELPTTQYYALGYTGGSWSNYLALYNPGSAGTTAYVLFTKVDGSTVPYTKTLAAGERFSFKVDNVAGMSNTDYSTRVTADPGVLAELGLYYYELNPTLGGSGGFAMRGEPAD